MKLYILDKTSTTFIKKLSSFSREKGAGQDKISKSYSQEVMAICVSKERTVGIDLEKRRIRSPETISHFVEKFATFQLKNVPRKVNEEWFYKAWTAMESYFKLAGDGFGTQKDFTLDLEGKSIWRDSSEVAWFEHYFIDDYICCLCSDEMFSNEDVQIIDRRDLDK